MLSLQPQLYFSPSDKGSLNVTQTKRKLNGEIGELMKTGATYLLPLERRNYKVSEDGYVYIGTSGHTKPRVIDIVKESEKAGISKPKNTLLRELTTRIKGGKDEYTAQDQNMKRFAQLLLQIAGDKNKRDFLRNIRDTYQELISGNYMAQDITPEIESTSEVIYKQCFKRLSLSPDDENIISYFSWEWKSTFSHCPYYCKVWMIVVCILQMINLDKE